MLLYFRAKLTGLVSEHQSSACRHRIISTQQGGNQAGVSGNKKALRARLDGLNSL